MKKTIIVILVASALYAAAVNMRIKGTSSERGYTRRMGGVYGYLHQAPSYYRPYVPEKWTCCKGRPCIKRHKKSKKRKKRRRAGKRTLENRLDTI